MSLTKVNYIDNSTIITAKNLNDIQDNIIQNAELINITAKNLNDIQDNIIKNAELIKKAAPRNLLDNSDFRNPVNQRGQTVYTGSPIYTIDRWKIYGGTLSVSLGGYVAYTGSFFQYIAGLDLDKTYTFAVGLVAGIAIVSGKLVDQPTATLGNTKIYMRQTSDGYVQVVLEPGNGNEQGGAYWAALYEGEYTLETLPEYQPKGYGVESTECKRYFRKFVHGKFAASTSAGSYKNAEFYIPDHSFRVIPTINVPVYNANYISAVFVGQSAYLEPTSIEVLDMTDSGICLRAILPQSVGYNCAGVVNLHNCELSADL